MAEADLHIELRDKKHQKAKMLRRSGRIPGIFYAHNEDSVPFSVDEKELQHILHREVNILNIIFPTEKPRKSILREIQRDPVTGSVIHVDVMGIKLTEKIRMTIPIVLKGAPKGVKEGGILEHLLREVEVEGLPLEIPEHVEVDVSELQIGDNVTLERIPQDKFRFIIDSHHAVANVIHPKVVVEEPKVVTEEIAPEMVEEKRPEKPSAEDEKSAKKEEKA